MADDSSSAPKPRVTLEDVTAAHQALQDAARPDAVARQRKRKRWTVREGVAALTDAGSFVEYGGLARPAIAGVLELQAASDRSS